jgi:hypothetical protein
MWLTKPVTVPAWVALLGICAAISSALRGAEFVLSMTQ